MTIKLTDFGGTAWSDGDVLYAADLSDTIENPYTYMHFTKQIAASTYNATADNTAYLSDTIWVSLDASAGKIYKTINGGGAYTEKTDGLATDSMLYTNPNDCNYMIVFGDAFGNAVKYSDDAGDTWTSVTPHTDADGQLMYSITDTGRIYCIFADGVNWECAYTDNAGTAWTSVADPGIGDGLAATGLQMASPKNACITYSFYDNPNTYTGYSLDTGGTWTDNTVTAQAHLGYSFYIDSDNYAFDWTTTSASKGVHLIVWGGTTMSSAVNQSFTYSIDGSNVQIIRILVKFTSTEFRYAYMTQDTDHTSAIDSYFVIYDTNNTTYPVKIACITYSFYNNPNIVVYRGVGSAATYDRLQGMSYLYGQYGNQAGDISAIGYMVNRIA